jgi:hypothetical protein
VRYLPRQRSGVSQKKALKAMHRELLKVGKELAQQLEQSGPRITAAQATGSSKGTTTTTGEWNG